MMAFSFQDQEEKVILKNNFGATVYSISHIKPLNPKI
jgi:hypothetical protein